MNTRSTLTAFAVVSTFLAAAACGTQDSADPGTGSNADKRSAAEAAEAAEAARQARAEHADALRWARGHVRVETMPFCRVSPDAVEHWAAGGSMLPCVTRANARLDRYGDDRRTSR